VTTSIIFTFIGADKPGLVEKIASTVSQNGGNWLESRMSQLAGYFTGITRVQVNDDQADKLALALKQLSGTEITISIQADTPSICHDQHTLLALSLLGNDRPGIVRELSSALARFNINVCEMNTHITSAPMTAEPLFEAYAEIQVPTNLNLNELSDRLDEIANELDVDIKLEECGQN
jgi:glycine cleavage system regulatory protein